ncbi:MAG: type II toxin-antitoxin system VapC family toxin [Candidatus Omnitrophica bacterium]|nr:type II toxin-antitoxin system VapC family toxin [Candidatus Omnitrophota bacterium]
MRSVKVLDSWALLAYFEKEAGCDQVTRLLKEAAEEEKDLLISVINWGEVLYVIEGRHGKEKRDAIDHLMNQMHLEVVDADKELTREAARIKADEKLHYADCFAAALANTRKATFVTGDKDFKRIESQLKILWLR